MSETPSIDASAHAAHGPEEMRKHIQAYINVFIALGVLTVVTVGVSYLHLALGKAVGVALAIATLKASLVAAVFMHLSSERKIIFYMLALCAAFFVVLMLIPTFTHMETGV